MKKFLKTKHLNQGVELQAGLPVVDKDGNMLGPVKEIHQDYFVIDRSVYHAPDLTIPIEACTAGAEQVMVHWLAGKPEKLPG